MKHVAKHFDVDRDVPECRYWRFQGCHYGKKCNYLHLQESKRIDLKELLECLDQKQIIRKTKNVLESDQKDSSSSDKRKYLMTESHKTSAAYSVTTCKERRFEEDALIK